MLEVVVNKQLSNTLYLFHNLYSIKLQEVMSPEICFCGYEIQDKKFAVCMYRTQSTMSLHSIPPIEKLKRYENYDSWKFAVQTYLEHEEL